MAEEFGSEKKDIIWKMKWHWIGYVLLVVLFFLLYRCFRVLFESLLKLYRRSLAYVNPKYRRRLALLKWLEKRAEQKINGFSELWENPEILGNVISCVIPIAYDQETETETETETESEASHHDALQQIQLLVSRYFDIRPMFLGEELKKPWDRKIESKFIRLLHVIKASIEKLERTTKQEDAGEYVARGMGLITATKGHQACFFIYSRHELDFDSMHIKITGPEGDTGETTITGLRSSPITSTTCMQINYEVIANASSSQDGVSKCLKVVYSPKHIGEYRLDIMKYGYVILGSPFNITVEDSSRRIVHSSSSKPETRVINRVVDFVNEKMLLTDKGELIKISCDAHSNPAMTKLKTQIDEQSSVAITLAKILQKDAARQVRPTPEMFFEICEYIMKTCHFILQNSSSRKGLRLVSGANKFISGDSMLLDDGVITEVAHTEQEMRKLLEARAAMTVRQKPKQKNDTSSDPDVIFLNNLLEEEADTRKPWLLQLNNDEASLVDTFDDDVFCVESAKNSLAQRKALSEKFLSPEIINRSQLNTPDIVYMNLLETEESVTCRQDDAFVQSAPPVEGGFHSSVHVQGVFSKNRAISNAVRRNHEPNHSENDNETLPICEYSLNIGTDLSQSESTSAKSMFTYLQDGSNVTIKSPERSAKSLKITLKKQQKVPDAESIKDALQECLDQQSAVRPKIEITDVNDDTEEENNESMKVHISVRKIINDFEEMLHAQNAQVDNIIKTILEHPVDEHRKTVKTETSLQCNSVEENRNDNFSKELVKNPPQSSQNEELYDSVQQLHKEMSKSENFESDINLSLEENSFTINKPLSPSDVEDVERNFQTELLQTVVAPFVDRMKCDEIEDSGIVHGEILEIGKTLVEALMRLPVQTDLARNVIKRLSSDKSLSIESVQRFLSSMDKSSPEGLLTTEKLLPDVSDTGVDSKTENGPDYSKSLDKKMSETNAKEETDKICFNENESSNSNQVVKQSSVTEDEQLRLQSKQEFTSTPKKDLFLNSTDNVEEDSNFQNSESINLVVSSCADTSVINQEMSTYCNDGKPTISSMKNSCVKSDQLLESIELQGEENNCLTRSKAKEKTFDADEESSATGTQHLESDVSYEHIQKNQIDDLPSKANDFYLLDKHIKIPEEELKPTDPVKNSSENTKETKAFELTEDKRPASGSLRNTIGNKTFTSAILNDDQDVEGGQVSQPYTIQEKCTTSDDSPNLGIDTIKKNEFISFPSEEIQTVSNLPESNTECQLDTSGIVPHEADIINTKNKNLDLGADSLAFTEDTAAVKSNEDGELHSYESAETLMASTPTNTDVTKDPTDQSDLLKNDEGKYQEDVSVENVPRVKTSDESGSHGISSLEPSTQLGECTKTLASLGEVDLSVSPASPRKETITAQSHLLEPSHSSVPDKSSLDSSEDVTNFDLKEVEPHDSKSSEISTSTTLGFDSPFKSGSEILSKISDTLPSMDSNISQKLVESSIPKVSLLPNDLSVIKHLSASMSNIENSIKDCSPELEADSNEIAESRETDNNICKSSKQQDLVFTENSENKIGHLHHQPQIPSNCDTEVSPGVDNQNTGDICVDLTDTDNVKPATSLSEETKELEESYNSEVSSNADLEIGNIGRHPMPTPGIDDSILKIQTRTENDDSPTEVMPQPSKLTPEDTFNPADKIRCKLCSHLPNSSFLKPETQLSESLLSVSKIKCKLCSDNTITRSFSSSSTLDIAEKGSLQSRPKMMKQRCLPDLNTSNKQSPLNSDMTDVGELCTNEKLSQINIKNDSERLGSIDLIPPSGDEEKKDDKKIENGNEVVKKLEDVALLTDGKTLDSEEVCEIITSDKLTQSNSKNELANTSTEFPETRAAEVLLDSQSSSIHSASPNAVMLDFSTHQPLTQLTNIQESSVGSEINISDRGPTVGLLESENTEETKIPTKISTNDTEVMNLSNQTGQQLDLFAESIEPSKELKRFPSVHQELNENEMPITNIRENKSELDVAKDIQHTTVEPPEVDQERIVENRIAKNQESCHKDAENKTFSENLDFERKTGLQEEIAIDSEIETKSNQPAFGTTIQVSSDSPTRSDLILNDRLKTSEDCYDALLPNPPFNVQQDMNQNNCNMTPSEADLISLKEVECKVERRTDEGENCTLDTDSMDAHSFVDVERAEGISSTLPLILTPAETVADVRNSEVESIHEKLQAETNEHLESLENRANQVSLDLNSINKDTNQRKEITDITADEIIVDVEICLKNNITTENKDSIALHELVLTSIDETLNIEVQEGLYSVTLDSVSSSEKTEGAAAKIDPDVTRDDVINILYQETASDSKSDSFGSKTDELNGTPILHESATEPTVFKINSPGSTIDAPQEEADYSDTLFDNLEINTISKFECSPVDKEQDQCEPELQQNNGSGFKDNQMGMSSEQLQSFLSEAAGESIAEYPSDSMMSNDWLEVKADRSLSWSQSSETLSEPCSDVTQVNNELDFESIISAPTLDVALKKLEQKINSAHKTEHVGVLEELILNTETEVVVESRKMLNLDELPNRNLEEFTTTGSNEPLFDWETIKAMGPAEREIWGLSITIPCDKFGDKSSLFIPTSPARVTRPNSPSMDTITEVQEETEEHVLNFPRQELRSYSAEELPIITFTPEQPVEDVLQASALTDQSKLSPLDDSRFQEDLKILSVLDYMNVSRENVPTCHVENFGHCLQTPTDDIPEDLCLRFDSVQREEISKECYLTNISEPLDGQKICFDLPEGTVSTESTSLGESTENLTVVSPSTPNMSLNISNGDNRDAMNDKMCTLNDNKEITSAENVDFTGRHIESNGSLIENRTCQLQDKRQEEGTATQIVMDCDYVNTNESKDLALSFVELNNTRDLNCVPCSGLSVKEVRETFESLENSIKLKEHRSSVIDEVHNAGLRSIEKKSKQFNDKELEKVFQRTEKNHENEIQISDEPVEEQNSPCELLMKDSKSSKNNIFKEEKEKINEHIAALDRDTRISRSNLVAFWKIYWDNIVEENQTKNDSPTKCQTIRSAVTTGKTIGNFSSTQQELTIKDEYSNNEEECNNRNKRNSEPDEIDILKLNIIERISLFESMVSQIKLERRGLTTKVHVATATPTLEVLTGASNQSENLGLNEEQKFSEGFQVVDKNSSQCNVECIELRNRKCFQKKFIKLKEYFELLEQSTGNEKQASYLRKITENQIENTFSSNLVETQVRSQCRRRRRKRKSSRRQLEKGIIQSAPTSDSETPAQHTYQMWGSERLGQKVVERIHIKDLFQDVFNETGFFRGGVPNRKAVLASLRSIDLMQEGMSEDVQYDEDDGKDLELLDYLAEPGKISNVPRGYQNVYPWIPTTPIHEYRSRPCAENNLIPRNALLQASEDE